ncbi:putative oxidoreductase [Sphingobium herbicidovorans NBRC 16415]|uniref:Oxidoreductase n=1 Tax=Sphingobium herbicidovorans (strain ATCC 700291 / DSM 11019 / CCUG 56400 / KCTC 2939 / LMG 18315 / NBRC 16415 / MH) TaxID=1219045 RepID=A0A086P548_SPHHM|nr:oxidoreductase [Sphingobium herbicidovorans]KFG88516.1 putative oxidoreductase [Sphingobium herbicidovorans NBRC 16415]
MGFTTDDMPDQRGCTMLVTGANTGIGFEAAKALAGKGARVLLGCRDADRGKAAMAQIATAVPDADLDLVLLDQADLASVRAAADRIADEPRLDVLLNNAGVMIPPLSRTAQKFELQFGVNHLGTFALTALLLPKLAETAGARVVVTSSLAHRRGEILWSDWNAEQNYSPNRYYSQSKLANLMFALELDRRLRAVSSPVSAIACHPGVALTELMRHLPKWTQPLMPLVRPLFNPVAAAAWPALQAATDRAAQGGEYFGPQGRWEMRGQSGPAFVQDHTRDVQAARRLWDLSIQATGIDPGLPAS